VTDLDRLTYRGAIDALTARGRFGISMGLERVERLMAEVGHPERGLRGALVGGTNGKGSVVALLRSVLAAAGYRVGTMPKPHLVAYRERIAIDGEPIGADAFAAAIARVLPAIDRVAEEIGPPTEFEALTAAAIGELARQRVDLAVVEVGMGGRLDATNVLASRVTALTSVGLDHTRWLGPTTGDIAAEKLAVLRPGTTLVVGELEPEILELARARAAECDARLVRARPAEAEARRWKAPYLRRNLGVAREAAGVLLGELDEAAVERAARRVLLAGRFELVEGDPPLVLDAAHNPQGAAALAEALSALAGGRPVVACLALLADKDADGIADALAPALAAACCCAIPSADVAGSGRPGAASVPAAELAGLLEARGVQARTLEAPGEAIEEAIRLARERNGVALLAGSHYLLRYAWIARRAQSCSR
jgi:dihydrofolate synthase / folylpolyglutamate synthase